MANIQITQGSGTTMRTDTLAGAVEVQAVKLLMGAVGAEDALLDSGQQLMVNSIPVVIASNQSALPITNATVRAMISPTGLTVGGGAYAQFDIVGGKQTLTNAVRSSGGTGLWQSLMLRDTSGERPALMVLLFDADLAITYSDNGVSTLNAADVPKIVRAVLVPSAAWNLFGGVGLADVNIEQSVKAASGQNLYALWMATGTPTLVSGCLSATYAFIQD